MKKLLYLVLIAISCHGVAQGNYPWKDELLLSTGTPASGRTELAVDGSGKLYYIGTDYKVHNYWKDANNNWNENPLNSTMPLATTANAGITIDPNSGYVYYVATTTGTTVGTIHACTPTSGLWPVNAITIGTGTYVPPKASSKLAMTLLYGTSTPRIYYIGTDSKIHYVQQNGSNWDTGLLNATPSASVNLALYSNLRVDDAGVVYYAGTDFKIRCQTSTTDAALNISATASRGNTAFVLQKIAGSSYPRVFYVGTDNKIYGLEYSGSSWAIMALPTTAPLVYVLSCFTVNNNQLLYLSQATMPPVAIYQSTVTPSVWTYTTLTSTPATVRSMVSWETQNGVSYYFDGTGNLHKLSQNLTVTNITAGHGKKYEKFEIGVSLPSSIQQNINDFLDNSHDGGATIPAGSKNPYDQYQLKVKAIFKDANGNSFIRYGFFYRSVTADPTIPDYKYYINPSLETSPFRVRIAPENTGNWTVNVELYIDGILANTGTGSFTVDASSRRGPLSLPDASKYLKDANNNDFFIVGQNTDCQLNWGSTPIRQYWPMESTPALYKQVTDAINDLADKNANFVRLRALPHSYDIEGAYIYNQNLPFKSLDKMLNNYDSRQHVAWELDKTMDTLQKHNMYSLFTLFYDPAFFFENNAGQDNMDNWQYNPYSTEYGALGMNSSLKTSNQPPDKVSYTSWSTNTQLENSVTAFFTDHTPNTGVFKKVQNKVFYFMARWGYSPNIAMWQTMNETDHLGDLYPGHQSLWPSADPAITPTAAQLNFESNVIAWLDTVNTYLKGFYPKKLIINGFGLPNYADQNSSKINSDIASSNPYRFNVWDNDNRFEEQAKFKTDPTHPKPYISGEQGFISTVDDYTDIEAHKAIWCGIFSGSLGTPLYFWDQYQSHATNHRSKLTYVADFISNVDLTNENWTPYHNNEQNNILYKRVQTFYMKNSSSSTVIGWVHNFSYNWYSNQLHGNIPALTYDPTAPGDGNIGDYSNPAQYGPTEKNLNIVNTTDPLIHVDGMIANTTFLLELYDTYHGYWLVALNKSVTSDGTGRVYLDIALNNTIGSAGFNPDYAFRLKPLYAHRKAESLKPIDSFEFNVYPNPANNSITVTSEHNIDKVEIINLTGQVLASETTNSIIHKLSLENIANGVYFVKVYNNDTKSVNIKKLVIQK